MMGGTDMTKSDTRAKSKPPLPPKPIFIVRQNGIVKSETQGVEESNIEILDDESENVKEILKIKDNECCNVKLSSPKPYMKPNTSEEAENTESNFPSQSECVKNLNPSVETTVASSSTPVPSDKTSTKKSGARGRTSQRATRQRVENGDSGDEACCIRFAGMVRHKAVDLASHSKLLPPIKPPKPDVARPKGKRRKGSQQNGLNLSSVGDDLSIDGSRHGVRFVDDDETESSTDYRDIDNNSVFLLELACHSDAQTISRGEYTEYSESGYCTSDVTVKDEDINILDSNVAAAVSHDIKCENVEPVLSDQTFSADKEDDSSNQKDIINEKEKNEESEKHSTDLDSEVLPEIPQVAELSVETDIKISEIAEVHPEIENEFPVKDSTDVDGTEKKEIVAHPITTSTQIKKRVKSPPRPPPPRQSETKPVTVLNEQLADIETTKSAEDKIIHENESIDAHSPQTEDSVLPLEEVPTVSKKRVTSPSRPPPPKFPEVPLKITETVTSTTKDENISTEKRKHAPPVPTKPLQKDIQKQDVIEIKKSSLEPLDLSVKEEISPTKPVSLSPRTFPRSRRRSPKRLSPGKKIEFSPMVSSSQASKSADKPVLTAVVRNNYLEGLKPLPTQRTSKLKKSPSRPPPPQSMKPLSLQSAVENKESAVLDVGGEDSKTDERKLNDLIENKTDEIKLNDLSETKADDDETPIKSTDGQCLVNEVLPSEPIVTAVENEEEPAILDVGEGSKTDEIKLNDLTEIKADDETPTKDADEQCLVNEVSPSEPIVIGPAMQMSDLQSDIPVQDDKKSEKELTNLSSLDEIQSSTWPIAAERKKRKMKSPPRPPLPINDKRLPKANVSVAASPSEDMFNRQTFETSSLDSRGRKRIKSPPRPPPPQYDIRTKDKEVSVKSEFSPDTSSSIDTGTGKRIKSPPRPPPPIYEKLPLKRSYALFVCKEISPDDKNTELEKLDESTCAPLASEEKSSTDDLTTDDKKRISSPPRPPPPIYEKLPLKKTTNEVQEDISKDQTDLTTNSKKRISSPPRPPPPIYEKLPLKKTTNEVQEDISKDQTDLTTNNKKRVSSPPRPPPPIYEKLPVKKTNEIHEDISKDKTEDKKLVQSPPRPPPPQADKATSKKENLNIVLKDDSYVKQTEHKSQTDLEIKSVTFSEEKPEQSSPTSSVTLHEYEEIKDPSSFDETFSCCNKLPPKPPPRVRRHRSRTVEVVTLTEKPEERKRRSHSLTESDILRKKEERELLDPQHSEVKHLYTKVQKDRDKMILLDPDASSEGRTTPNYDKMKFRPLPAPPPPPRSRSRLSMSQSPASLHQSPVPEEDNQHKINQDITLCQETFLCDENANISTSSYYTVNEPESEKDDDDLRVLENMNDLLLSQKIIRASSERSKEKPGQRSQSPSRRSKSSSPGKQRSSASWYDESDVSGDLGDVDTSLSSQKESMEGLNNCEEDVETLSSSLSKQKQSKKSDSQKKNRNSTFYCEVGVNTQQELFEEKVVIETERPVSSSSLIEKSVQTSPERELVLSSPSKDDQSDDTDDLLNRASTVQRELCLILERRKRKKTQSTGGEDDTKSSCSYSPSPKNVIRRKIKLTDDVSASDQSPIIQSPQPELEICTERREQLSSTRSSNSEISWQDTSSEESEDEAIERSPIFLQSKKQKKAFHIAKEIMTSEESFINCLKLLNEDYRKTIEDANKERSGTLIPEDIINYFLRYFPQLQNLNENLLTQLKDRIEHWDENCKIADIIVKIGPFLKLYSSYIRDFDALESAFDESRKKYPLFDQVTKEFESSNICKKLALKHYMLKPIQRIPQYRLLLQEYIHNLTEDSLDYVDTVSALQIVSEVANHANESLRQGDNFQKLVSIQNSIIGSYEIVHPGRVFLKEGELMKLSRKEMQPRWFILFNDSLLYLTCVQQGLYKINHELPLTGMKVHIPQHDDYKNEFSIISVARSFTLAARSLDERQEWVDSLNKAIVENASKRSTFTNVMLQQKINYLPVDSTFVLGKQAPVWIPDGRVTMCQLCTSEFTVTFRRHHCRACGKVVCSVCSANKAPLQYRNFQVARVCDECFPKLQKEFEAIEPAEKAVEASESGSSLDVLETDSDSSSAFASIKAQFKGNVKAVGKKTKRQLPSVLKEVCANDQGSSISGYLYRRHRKGWKHFWFVLKDKVLYTYKASEDIAAEESLPLLGFQVETFTKPLDNIEAELLFQLTHPGQSPIVFHSDSLASTERWVQAMQDATILE